MHGLDLDGRAIVPLRAVVVASGGQISPLAIALAVGDDRRFLEDRQFATRLIGHWMVGGVTPHQMLPAEFAATLEAVSRLAEENAPVRSQIQALPASVFVYQDELDTLVKEINDQRCKLPPYGPGWAPIELSEWPRVSEADEQLVLEGFEALGAARTGVTPSSPAALRGYDLELQRRANDIAVREQERRGRWPTKNDVAKLLANECGKSEGNVVRRIRKEWPPRKWRTRKRKATAKRSEPVKPAERCVTDD